MKRSGYAPEADFAGQLGQEPNRDDPIVFDAALMGVETPCLDSNPRPEPIHRIGS